MGQVGAPCLRRGFTLTEIAIVLGIIGLILGAIWTAAAMVHTNYQTTTATREVLTVVQNIRSLYAGQPGFSAADLANVDITCNLVSMNVFPSDMIPEAPCIRGVITTYPQGPWSGSVMVIYAGTFGDGGAPDTIGVNAAGQPFHFSVRFFGQPNSASEALAAQVLNLQSNGLSYICDSNNWQGPLPVPLSTFHFGTNHIDMDWSLQ